jgi:hypothetical protein
LTMAKLSFLGDLNSEQLEYARIIGEKAKEMGVPPRLAIAIAFKESGLNPNAPRGADGEYGIMQVMPRTGKGMGFTNKDLADPEKNIEAGLKYLKQNLDAFGGDPKLATIGYNAGTDSPFFSGGDLPKTTESYLKAMKGYGAYSDEVGAPAPAEQPEENDMVVVQAPPTEETAPDTSNAPPSERVLGGGLGALTGATLSGARGVGNVLDSRAVARAGAEEAARIQAQRAAGLIPQQGGGATSGERWAAKTGYGKGAGTVQDVSSRYQRAMGQGKISGRMDKLWGVPQEGESPALAQRLIDRAKVPTQPSMSGLDWITNKFAKMAEPVAKTVSTAGRVLGPVVGGLTAGVDLAELAHEYQKPQDQRDLTKMGLSAASGLGGVMSMFPATMPYGVPLSAGASGIQALRENPDPLKTISNRAGEMPYFDPMGYTP